MTRRSLNKDLKVEFPGGSVLIKTGLHDSQGRAVVYISVDADGNRYAGDPEYWVNGEPGNGGMGLRIIQTTKLGNSNV